MKISKNNKKVILLLLKLKGNKIVFIGIWNIPILY